MLIVIGLAAVKAGADPEWIGTWERCDVGAVKRDTDALADDDGVFEFDRWRDLDEAVACEYGSEFEFREDGFATYRSWFSGGYETAAIWSVDEEVNRLSVTTAWLPRFRPRTTDFHYTQLSDDLVIVAYGTVTSYEPEFLVVIESLRKLPDS